MNIDRRRFLATPALLIPRRTDARIDELAATFDDFAYRTPYKFGGREVDKVTVLNIRCRLSLKSGKSAEGFASMPLGNVWSFPAPGVPYETTLNAMRVLAEWLVAETKTFKDYAHPMDINHQLEPQYLKVAELTSKQLGLKTPIPKLCTLVTASPIDSAIHDAFGKLHSRSSFAILGKDFMRHDLSHYLNAKFRFEYPDRYIAKVPAKQIRLYHSVGASDPLTAREVTKPIHDGLPESLDAWIPYSGVTAIKIKLNGNDLLADAQRVANIHRVTAEAQAKRGVDSWIYSLDFNERCPNVQYLLAFERRLDAEVSDAFRRVQYIEQPTDRDLAKNKANTMFDAAKLRPVVIDESLTGLDTLLLAQSMGYTGVALKACKGQSQTILMAAAASKFNMFRCVQDLTCPGAALVQSAGIAAHIPGVTALEANARQYVPSASKGWDKRYPGLFNVRNGYLDTSTLTGPGLGT